mmetsp:Transcript_14521/g.22721  ORF Transcript_14521/g.22721 Transcript_14521/m.22721 type:complete len:437 (-) Transcript_14521:345-1655(-)|eukprot:CAMPEP_0195301060 /NCGR_PEP_ID=MMETSP0707-20130614/28678_1 /TAXON_ID=33640 /ORGANISM="Asterionellopsis glacialis, Strain CCMP134" /LENGTH=436 /DNA_ID=CAMNT_0040363915 /DNA_START=314 /DNA_END=1624 /DNA_ORIENTATION=-
MAPQQPQPEAEQQASYAFPDPSSLMAFSLDDFWKTLSEASAAALSLSLNAATKPNNTPSKESSTPNVSAQTTTGKPTNISSNSSVTSTSTSSTASSSSSCSAKLNVIDPNANIPAQRPCPCCNRSKLNYTVNDHEHDCEERNKFEGLHGLSILDEEELQEDDDIMPGVLASGVKYTPKRVLAEGLMHKKGTGKDWRGSTDWKLRYAKLALAQVSGYEVEVPILMIYWFRSSEKPSTVILLDSTVVVPVDLEDASEWNAFCFNIIHVRSENKEQTTRVFTVPSKKARDEWVYSINETLLTFEKAKVQAHRELTERPKSPIFAMQMMGLLDSGNPEKKPVLPGDRRSISPTEKHTYSSLVIEEGRERRNADTNYHDQNSESCDGQEVSITMPLSPVPSTTSSGIPLSPTRSGGLGGPPPLSPRSSSPRSSSLRKKLTL